MRLFAGVQFSPGGANRMIKRVVVAIALISCTVPQVFSAAEAQQYANSKGGYKVDANRLQPASWHKSPLEMHILDMTPRVIDMRNRQAQDTYTINVGPVPETPGNNYVIGAPGPNDPNATAGGGGRNPGSTTPNSITFRGLPRAGFEANAPLAQPLGRNLPNGNSTNLLGNSNANLSGQMLTRQRQTRTGPIASAGRPIAMNSAPAMYRGDYRGPGGNTASSGSSNSNVYGKMLHRLSK